MEVPTVRTFSGDEWFFGGSNGNVQQAHPVLEFLVPARLVRIEAVFTAEVENHSLKKPQTLSFNRTWRVDDHSDSVTAHDFHIACSQAVPELCYSIAQANSCPSKMMELCALGKDGETKTNVECAVRFEYASKVEGWL